MHSFCVGNFGKMPTSEWINDEARTGDFVFLLNQLLGKHMRRCGIRYNQDFGRSYFPRENATDMAFKRKWTSVRTEASDERTVAKYYEYGHDKFWRHLALETSFDRFGESWFLRIMPKYFFTEDGEKPCDGELAGRYTTSLKADEHNIQVLNHVLFWADVLSLQQSYISVRLDNDRVMLIEKTPLTGIARFAIPDDPATYDEQAALAKPSLFDLMTDEDEEGDADA